MNQHQNRGQANQIKGGAEEVAGKVLGDKKLEVKGKVQNTVGKVQERFGDAKAERDARKPN